MNVLLISTDLVIQSRVASAATRGGFAPPTTGNADSVESFANPTDFGLVILDLSTPGLDVAQAVPVLRERLPELTPIVALAPHVHTSKFTAARQAACDQVLSRGQFDREIDELLKRSICRGEQGGGKGARGSGE